MMEPDHVNKTPSHDFPPAAAAGVLCNGLRGRDDHEQELLAERGQAEHAIQNRWFAKRYLRVRAGRTPTGARGESERRWIGNALSGRPEGPVVSVISAMELAIAIAHGLRMSTDLRNPINSMHQNGRSIPDGLSPIRRNRRQGWKFAA